LITLSRLLKRLRGVSSLVAVVVLIAVVIVGGFLLFWMVQNNLFRQSPAAKLSIDTSQLVRDTAGNVIFSTVIKNSGSKPCKTINITLNGENMTSYNLSTEPLEPGHTIILAPEPTEIYVLGDTYPVTIVGVFSDGSSASLSQTVTCTGAGGYIEKRTIMFDSEGLDSSSSGTVLTVDGDAYNFSSLPLSFNWLRGTTHSFEWADSVATTNPEERFLWLSTTGLSSKRAGTVVVSFDGTIKAAYEIFATRSITFDYEGIGGSTATMLKVDDTDYAKAALPKTFYWANGSTHTFSWYATVSGVSETQYVWTSTTGLSDKLADTLIVSVSGDVNATYKTQYLLTVVINPASGGAVDLSSGWFDAGTIVNATATPAGNYIFADWILDGVIHTENPITLTFDRSHSLTAEFILMANVTFEVSDMQTDAVGTVLTIDETAEYLHSDLPKTFSWVVGSSHTFSWAPQVSDDTGKRYLWVYSTGLSTAQSGMILVAADGGNVTAFYNTEYLVTITTSTGGTTDPAPGTYWRASGTTFDITALPEVSYVLDYWEVNSVPSGNATVLHLTIDKAYNVHAVFRLSTVPVTFDSTRLTDDASSVVLTVDTTLTFTYIDLPKTFDWIIGSSHTYSYSSIVSSTATGKRFRLTSVSGPTSPITVSSSVTITGNYVKQWLVTFTHTGLDVSASGTVVTVDGVAKTHGDLPFSEWVDDFWDAHSASISYLYSTPVSSSTSGKQFILTGVTGPTSPFPVEFAVNVTGNYKTQYYLTLATNLVYISDPTGEGWCDAMTTVSISTSDLEPVEPGKRARFYEWTTGDMSEILNASASATQVFMDKPKTVTANYIVQWNVTFTHSGLDVSTTGTVVIVDGATKQYSDLPFVNWYDEGTIINYVYMDPVSSTIEGKRFDLTSVDGPTSPITIDSKIIVTGNYTIQWNVTFAQTGLDSSATGTIVIVDGVLVSYGSLPYSKWVDNLSSVTYAYTSPVSSSTADKRFQLTSTSGPPSPFTATSPVTVTGNYVIQWNVTFAQTGLASSANGTVVTVDGFAKAYADLPFSKWVDSGASVTYSYSNPVLSSTTGKRFSLSSVSGQASPITVTSATTVIGNYVVQWNVTFTHSGLDSTANSTVVYVDIPGVYTGNLVYGNLPYTAWVEQGTNFYYSYFDVVTSNTAGKQFKGVDVPTGVAVVEISSPMTIVGNYVVQWNVTFTHTGLDSSSNERIVTVSVLGDLYYVDLPYSYWVTSGTTVTYSYYQYTGSLTAGKRFSLTSVTGPASPITVDAKTTVAGNYVVQYSLTITVTPLAGGSTSPAVGTYWYDTGTSVPVTATPVNSYRFDHWRLDGSDAGSANPISVSMTEAHTLEAVFIETAGITFNVSGIASGYSGTVLTVDGINYSLSELPKTFTQDVGSSLAFAWVDPLYDGSDKRYVWSSTSGLVTTRTGFITVPSGGGVVDAVYGTEYRLLISVADPTQGTTNPAPGNDIWYSSTASATVTALPSSGFAFDYWSLDGVANTANPITVPMSTNHTLVAHLMTAVFYKWSDGTTASSISLSYNLFNNTWTHDSNATYGIKSTGVYSTLDAHICLASISNTSVVENVTFIIRDGAGVAVATVTWAGGSLPTTPVSLSLATNVVYTIEVWIKGKATVSDVSVGVNITIP